MEERSPTSSATPKKFSHITTEDDSSKTYVIQLPKDQIYRTPPPVAHNYPEPKPFNDKKLPLMNRCYFCLHILSFFLFGSGLLCTIGGVFVVIVNPKLPKLDVNQVSLKIFDKKHRQQKQCQYNVTIKAENPNTRMSFLYFNEGKMSLFYKNRQIASGKPTRFYQKIRTSSSWHLQLRGPESLVPVAVKEKLRRKRSEVSIFLVLSMVVPTKLKIGSLRLWRMEMEIQCDIWMLDTDKRTHVQSNDCHVSIDPFPW